MKDQQSKGETMNKETANKFIKDAYSIIMDNLQDQSYEIRNTFHHHQAIGSLYAELLSKSEYGFIDMTFQDWLEEGIIFEKAWVEYYEELQEALERFVKGGKQ